MDFERIRPGVNDRAIVIGKTGCGKTTLARYLIEDQNKPYSVVYDAKISDAIGKWNDTQTIITELSQLPYAEEKRIIYRPPLFEERNSQAQDAFFEWVYFRKNTRLYIDEAYAVLGGTNPSFHLQACLTRGREKGISTIISTQRPKRIPFIFMSEAEHYYIFKVRMQEDMQRVYELTGLDPVIQASLNDYEFFYFNDRHGLYNQKLKLNYKE